MIDPAPFRRTRRALVLLLAIALLAACGSSGGDEAESTTTTGPATTAGPEASSESKTPTTKPEKKKKKKQEVEVGGLPTTEDDAPSGTWIAVRYLTEQDSVGDPPGFAEGRRYDIEATCEDDSCDLTLGPVDGSFLLPDIDNTDVGSDPIELEASDDAWSGTYVDTYGCTDELDGDFIESTATLGLAPIRSGDRIMSLVGTVTFEDELTQEGEAAGCTADSLNSSEYQLVMADVASVDEEFEIDGEFFESIEVATSEGVTAESGQSGYRGYRNLEQASTFSGSCAADGCAVSRVMLDDDDGSTTIDLTREDDDSLVATLTSFGDCTDASGQEVQALAYDFETEYALFPLLVLDGEAKVMVGQVSETRTPNDEGNAHPGVCDQAQSLVTYEYFVAPDLYS